jgi:jumonji domain-containing protein 7
MSDGGDSDTEEDFLVGLAAAVHTTPHDDNGASDAVPRLCCRDMLSRPATTLAGLAGRLRLSHTLRALVAESRPVVLTGGCVDHWPALRRWTHDYLRVTLADTPIHVALTPDGLGDAVAALRDGDLGFVRPHEARMPFSQFVDALECPLRDEATGEPRRAVHYASHQDSSLTEEFAPLWADTELELGWASAAFGRPPQAANFWMGEDAARTTVHADLYDNVYAVVRGAKTFTLLPPDEGAKLRRRQFRMATYVPAEEREQGACGHGLRLRMDEPAARTWWSPLDLERDGASLRPLRATVRAGEVLLLPALWWHAVSQRAGADGSTVAVNYWYEGPVARCDEDDVDARAERARAARRAAAAAKMEMLRAHP